MILKNSPIIKRRTPKCSTTLLCRILASFSQQSSLLFQHPPPPITPPPFPNQKNSCCRNSRNLYYSCIHRYVIRNQLPRLSQSGSQRNQQNIPRQAPHSSKNKKLHHIHACHTCRNRNQTSHNRNTPQKQN